MNHQSVLRVLAAAAALATSGSAICAQDTPARPAFDLPPSSLFSREALEAQTMRAARAGGEGGRRGRAACRRRREISPDVIAKFPPTLIITGTRAMDLTPAVYTNTQLLKAANSTLLVGEGMGHCFIYRSNLPEARDAYQVIVSFFRRNLK